MTGSISSPRGGVRPRRSGLPLVLALAGGGLAAMNAPALCLARGAERASTVEVARHAAPHGHVKPPSRAAHPGARAAGRAAGKHGGGRAAASAAPAGRHLATYKSGLPNVQALGALVLDENGRELYARSADSERPIASISKLAATLVVMDRGLELEGLSTITRADIEVARGGARSRLVEGITLSNRDLLHAALMGSDNRAIPALGRAVRLTPSQLAAEMTAKAKALGLKQTRFHDPTGLSVANVSTPRETILLLQAVMRHPILGPITRRVEYQAHPVGRPPITYLNTYRPAIRGNVEVLGGKTGYNDDARYCLVLAAKVEGKTCFMSFLANEGKMTRFGDVARVADWMIARRPKPAAPGPAGPTATTPPNLTASALGAAAPSSPIGPAPAMATGGALGAPAASAAPVELAIPTPPAPMVPEPMPPTPLPAASAPPAPLTGTSK